MFGGKLSLRTGGVYCPRKSWWSPWIKFENNQIRIRKSAGTEDWYVLNCKPDSNQSRKMENQLSNIKIIALDPGHIGGDYAEMEGRNFQIGTDPFVREGDLSLRVAKRLKSLLQGKGFEAILVRNQLQPVTSARPDDFERLVQNWIIDRNLTNLPEKKLQELKNKRRELLFYRVSEIRARAKLIVTEIQPDLTVCLHLNAAPWKDPDQKKLLDRNDYHVLVNGCFMGGELAYDDQRFKWSLDFLIHGIKPRGILLKELISALVRKLACQLFLQGPKRFKNWGYPWGLG